MLALFQEFFIIDIYTVATVCNIMCLSFPFHMLHIIHPICSMEGWNTRCPVPEPRHEKNASCSPACEVSSEVAFRHTAWKQQSPVAPVRGWDWQHAAVSIQNTEDQPAWLPGGCWNKLAHRTQIEVLGVERVNHSLHDRCQKDPEQFGLTQTRFPNPACRSTFSY